MHGTVDKPKPIATEIPALPQARRHARHRLAAALLAGAAIFIAVVVRYFVPVDVERAVVVAADMPINVSGPGLVEAKVSVAVSARVQARIMRIAVDEGQSVAPGHVLAELDLSDTTAQLRQARADAEAARAALVEAKRQHAGMAAVLANALADFSRKSELHAKGVSTVAQLDASRAAFEQAQAQSQQGEAAIDRAVAQLASAEAAAAVVAARLADGVIRAPVGGIVTSREKSAGDILVPGQSILQIVDPASLIVSVRLDESVMGGLGSGQGVVVRFASTGRETYAGRVLRLGRSVDTITREFRAEVALERLPRHWAVGQRATVTVTTALKPETLQIPRNFLATRDGRPGVWVDNGHGWAAWRPLTIGQSDADRVEIVSGLEVGAVVVKGSRLHTFARLGR